MQEKTAREIKFWGVAAAMLIAGVFAVAIFMGPKTIGNVAKATEQQCLDRIARDGWHPGPQNRKLTPEIFCAIKGHVKAREVACRQSEEACR
jgi:hypothetical protein